MKTLKFSNQKIFFTADTHYHHTNIVGPSVSQWKKGYRDFQSIEMMDDTLTNKINEVVAAEDTLFHLGDFAWGERNVIWFRERINCKNIYLILGNHDKEIRKKPSLQSLFTKVFEFGTEIFIDETRFVLCHYALKVWHQWAQGSIHLYGHSHGNLPPTGRSMDIGVDTNNFYPYNSDNVFLKMAEIPVVIDSNVDDLE